MKKWTIDDSKELYNITGWGTSYFGINDKGNMYVSPCKDNTQIDLREVMNELALRDVTPPVLLRFPDILDNRIEKTASCFKKAAKEYDYKAENFIIYPIKVNQMQPVVEEVRSSTSVLRRAQSPSYMPYSPYNARVTRSSFATDTKTRDISNWLCLHKRWANVSSS